MTRGECLEAVTTKLAGLTATPVAAWEGEERAFNPDAVFPCLYVSHDGVAFGEWQTLGASDARVPRTHRLSVYVSASSQASAFAVLDELEAGAPGVLGTTGRRLELVDGETLEAVELGRVLYRQPFAVRDP